MLIWWDLCRNTAPESNVERINKGKSTEPSYHAAYKGVFNSGYSKYLYIIVPTWDYSKRFANEDRR